jgi:16S rRNA (cytidine1402-2'-O)-methyltransferase
MSGALVLVATPIGNLSDMSERAVEALRTAAVIACEDSRHTQKLLNHFNIRVPTMSLHQHNEKERTTQVIERVGNGEIVALVTDAGMPAISDPGELVVAAVAAAGHAVTVVPGPSAVPAALAVSGLSTQRFCFEGFLPRKGSERSHRLTEIARETRTTVIYESPQRIRTTVDDLAEQCGNDRAVAMVRELTKIHEEIWRGTLAGLSQRLATEVKGECVLVLAGAPVDAVKITDVEIVEALEAELQAGSSKKDAVNTVCQNLGIARNRVYSLSLGRKS